MMELAIELERIALEDEYFIEKKLYPNVDFYSGIIYKALGIPISMFTVMFAIARTVGWVAQWLEQSKEPTKIGRWDGLPSGLNKARNRRRLAVPGRFTVARPNATTFLWKNVRREPPTQRSRGQTTFF